jgi:glycosyltransferase involved in cell wall biosynthesis
MKPSLRICYVNPTTLPKRPVSEISSRIADIGFKTTILLPTIAFKKYDKSLHHSNLLRKSKIMTYPALRLPFIKSEQPVPMTPKFYCNTLSIFKNNDVVHMWVPYYFSSLWIIFTKRLFYPRKKLILTMDTIPGYSFSMGKSMDTIFRIYNKLFGWLIYTTPDVITLYGKSLVPHALKAGVPRDKIRVLSTGIAMKKIDSKLKKSVRNELGINQKAKNSKTKIVLFAGLMVGRKGVEKIIRMADILRNEDVIFVLAGDGPEKDKYIAEAKRLGLSKKLLFLGWRKDMPRLYQAADLLVLPAEGEGLPGVVMEAMSYGVPCVASNIPCIPDLIRNGISGYLCNKDAPKDFAEKIQKLIRNDSLRQKMGKNALLDIKKFDWDVIIKKYEELYNDLLR